MQLLENRNTPQSNGVLSLIFLNKSKQQDTIYLSYMTFQRKKEKKMKIKKHEKSSIEDFTTEMKLETNFSERENGANPLFFWHSRSDAYGHHNTRARHVMP